MKPIPTRIAVSMSTVLLALTCAPSARGDDDPPRHLGDHPAIVVQRLHKAAGYDYASKFYPHPAWMHLRAEQPRDVTVRPHELDAAAPVDRDAPAAGTRHD
jgi:hypothetical protein